MCLQIFKACVAGGSVTSWSMYDTAYAERYLGYPLSACYSKSSILHLVDRLPDTYVFMALDMGKRSLLT